MEQQVSQVQQQIRTPYEWTKFRVQGMAGAAGAQSASKKSPPKTTVHQYDIEPVFPVQADETKSQMDVVMYQKGSNKRRGNGGGGRNVRRRGGGAMVIVKKAYIPRPVGQFQRGGFYGRFQRTGRSQELKYFDADFSVLASNSGTVIPSLNLISEGTDPTERIGRKVVIHSLTVKTQYLYQPASEVSNHSSQQVRTIIYIDKQCNGATAAASDVIGGGSNEYIQFREMTKLGRFRVLCDYTHLYNATAGLSGDVTPVWPTQRHQFNKHLRLKLPIVFDGPTGAIGEICCNNLGIIHFTRATTSGSVTCHSFVRIRFDG